MAQESFGTDAQTSPLEADKTADETVEVSGGTDVDRLFVEPENQLADEQEQHTIPTAADIAIDKMRVLPIYSVEEHEKYGADKPKTLRQLLRMRLEQIKEDFEGEPDIKKMNRRQIGATVLVCAALPAIGLATGHHVNANEAILEVEGMASLLAIVVAGGVKFHRMVSTLPSNGNR